MMVVFIIAVIPSVIPLTGQAAFVTNVKFNFRRVSFDAISGFPPKLESHLRESAERSFNN